VGLEKTLILRDQLGIILSAHNAGRGDILEGEGKKTSRLKQRVEKEECSGTPAACPKLIAGKRNILRGEKNR